MRYPEFLKEKGTIGFAAPSFGCAADPYKARFDQAKTGLQEMGYTCKTGPNCYAAEGIGISNSPEKCAEELMECYQDPESEILMSCGGGELMCETMSHVDFKTLTDSKPKWYLGYSDNTNMTFLLNTICDTASVYGVNGPGFGMKPWHKSLQDTLEILCGIRNEVSGYGKWEKESLVTALDPYQPYHTTQDRVMKLWQPEGMPGQQFVEDCRCFHGSLQLEGRLIGGCMDCLTTILGTRFDYVKEFQKKYEKDGFLWFLEACDLNVFGIRRAMWQMEEAGWFRHVKGFLIGRPLCFGQEMMGLDAYQAILAVAQKHQVPVLFDLDLGHLPPAMPIVSGSIGKVEVIGNDITIRYEFR